MERFRTSDLFEVSHVLISPSGSDEEAWRQAGLRARAIIREVGDNAAALAAAARQFSSCSSASQDGSLGQVRRGDLVPEVQEIIEKLAEGQTHKAPVRSRFGWHVIRLHRRIGGQILSFDAARDRIAEMLGARSWAIGATRYVASLADVARIEGISVKPPLDPAAF